MQEDVEGSCCGLSCQYGSNHEILVCIIGILVEMRTVYFPNTRQTPYRLSKPTQFVNVHINVDTNER